MKRPFLLFFGALLMIGCPGQNPAQGPQSVSRPAPTGPVKWKLSKSGLGFRISDADEDERPARAPVAASTPLSAEDTKKVLDRLPPLQGDEDDVKPFALREKSPPAPRPGRTEKQAFPPPRAPEGAIPVANANATLKVTRKAPVGSVELAPYLSVSFDSPIVPVTSLAELDKLPSPVKLTPEPPGKWRWVGAQTVMFQPDVRFPMATDYTVEVPAGTRATNGATLAQAEKWSFATPPPKLQDRFPTGNSVKLDPIFYASFDQAMDPEALLRTVRVLADGQRVAVRLATADEIEENAAVAAMLRRADQTQKRRAIAFRAEQPLQPATTVTVTFPKGTPSSEGPKPTTADQAYSFRTYDALRLVGHHCSWNERCTPLQPFTLQFSNPIDRGKFDRDLVKVTPEIAGLKVVAQGSSITLSGRTKGNTKYAVTVLRSLTDTFAQNMAKDATATFDVGPAAPVLFGEQRPMVALDPAGGPKLSVYSINDPSLKVRVYGVKPEDYAAYAQWRRDWDYDRKATTPPGRLLVQKQVSPQKTPDEIVSTDIDLKAAVNKEGFGHALVVVETTRPDRDRWSKEWVREWVQVTHLGLDASSDSEGTTAWVTDLATGSPLAGAEVSFPKGTAPGRTDKDGFASLAKQPSDAHFLIARSGTDQTFLPGPGDRNFSSYGQREQAFMFDDRQMYKPGEEAHIKGWLRTVDYSKGGDLRGPTGSGSTLRWSARDGRSAEVAKGETTVDKEGGFDFVVKIPGNANLGYANVRVEGVGGGFTHSFQIQEFRRPEFEVSAKTSEGPHFVGKSAIATVEALYFAGGGLPDAPANWTVTRTDGSFTPPNRSDYLFGKNEYVPYWYGMYGGSPRRKGFKPGEAPPTSETWTGKTNGQGAHRIRVDFDALEPSYPMQLAFAANVTDVNRQQWSANTTMLVHPADVYVGIKNDRGFVKAGEVIPLELIASDLDGKAVKGRYIKVSSVRLETEQRGEDWAEKELDASGCETLSQETSVRCEIKTGEGGRYRITAVVEDESGRKSQTTTSVWVTGPSRVKDKSIRAGTLELVTDKKEYKAGDSAEILVVSPFAPAEAWVSVQRAGIVRNERVTLKERLSTIRVPVDGRWLPGASVSVLLAGREPRENAKGEADESLPKKPAFARGVTHISIPPLERTLTLNVVPRDAKVEPGGKTTVEVDVKDARGVAVPGAEVAVVVVDEAVLALSGYKVPSPLSLFYPQRGPGTGSWDLRTFIELAEPDEAAQRAKLETANFREDGEGRASVGGLAGIGQGGGGSHKSGMVRLESASPSMSAAPPPAPPGAQPAAKPSPTATSLKKKVVSIDEVAITGAMPTTPIAMRANFSPLAAFSPAMITDAKGHASLEVKVPDNLTRYRITAVAAHETSFGNQEATITARLPLMVRPSAPRFLNFGDRFELPVVLQNQTDAPMEVNVAARALNAELPDTRGRKVTVPANDRVEIRLAAAAVKPGKARFQVGAGSGRFADAAEVSLPVWTPATTEAFATYGVIDQGAIAQPVKMPAGVVTQFGGLEVTTSSTQLQALTDAVIYLVKYPYECNEQLGSRVLAIAALKDVLAAFQSKDLPRPEVLQASVADDLRRLKARQNYNGGWGFWFSDPWPYLTIHVTHALARAKAKGFAVDGDMLSRAQNYVRNVESYIPAWYGPEARRALIAYSVYVRKLLGDADVPKAKRLIADSGGVQKMPIESLGWILPTLSGAKGAETEVEAIRKHLANRVTETAGAAHFVTSYGDSNYVMLHSDRGADGILLEALIQDQPTNDMIPKLVTGLLAHKKAGRWGSTQENAFVLLGLDKYFSTYEKITPDFVAKVWLGKEFAGDHTFKGRTTERSLIEVPMKLLAEMPGEQNLLLQKDGVGRLYYRIGMQYAPSDLKLPPRDEGFAVTRKYESVDQDSDVKKDDQGTWHVRAGSKVRVRLTMVATARRYHVALVDPIPAGLEPMNPALSVTGPIPQDTKQTLAGGTPWWWHRTWYEHQNMRDERVEAFASLLWDGIHEYVYVARATTPGTFVVPPTKAEEMYSPEVFGRSAGDKLVVE